LTHLRDQKCVQNIIKEGPKVANSDHIASAINRHKINGHPTIVHADGLR